MILAQAEPVVHEVIIQSSTPWHIYIAAVIGGLIAIAGWIVVHRTSRSRDLQNWRRGELLKHTSRIIELSTKRAEILRSRLYEVTERVFWTTKDWDLHSELIVEMWRLIDQLKLLQAQDLIDRFEALITVHQNSEYHIRDDDYDESALFLAMIDPDEQTTEHQKVIDEFHRTIQSKYRPEKKKNVRHKVWHRIYRRETE